MQEMNDHGRVCIGLKNDKYTPAGHWELMLSQLPGMPMRLEPTHEKYE